MCVWLNATSALSGLLKHVSQIVWSCWSSSVCLSSDKSLSLILRQEVKTWCRWTPERTECFGCLLLACLPECSVLVSNLTERMSVLLHHPAVSCCIISDMWPRLWRVRKYSEDLVGRSVMAVDPWTLHCQLTVSALPELWCQRLGWEIKSPAWVCRPVQTSPDLRTLVFWLRVVLLLKKFVSHPAGTIHHFKILIQASGWSCSYMTVILTCGEKRSSTSNQRSAHCADKLLI